VAVAGVTWGFNARELLARHGPDYLIDRPEELLPPLGLTTPGLGERGASAP
jgi:phosphoglycolate phosphatase-like HAD superfamily hydrolase